MIYFLIGFVLSLIPRENKIFNSASSLFSALIVVEIAFIAIFYSDSTGTKKAKEYEWKKIGEEKTLEELIEMKNDKNKCFFRTYVLVFFL